MSAVSVLLSPRDEALGARIVDALSRGGHDVHVVANDSETGDLFGAMDTDTAIVVWSNAALKLARLHDQAREALERGTLIPVAIGGAHGPAGFENVPPVDLSGWQGDDNDPRWRFVLEEISLASGRQQLADGDVWRGAAAAQHYEAKSDYNDAAPAPVAISSPDEDEWLAAPAVPQAPEAAPAEDISEDLSTGTTLRAREPIVFSAPQAPAASEPDIMARPPVRKRKRKARRFEPAAVAVGGVMALCVMTGAAMIFAPSFQYREQAVANPDLRDAEPINLAVLKPAFETQAEIVDEGPVAAAALENVPGTSPAQTNLIDDVSDLLAETSDAPLDTAGEETLLALTDPAAGEDPQTAQGDELVQPSSADTENAASLDALLATVPEIAEEIEEGSAPGQPEYAGEFFKDCSFCPDMRALDGGTFMMGSAPGEAGRTNEEGPIRQITIPGRYAIGTREVTNAQWDACVADGGCASYTPPDHGWGRDRKPVVSVSFEDAAAYTQWLSAKTGETYRLPSEAEWEYAARAGADTAFSFGSALQPTNANYDARYAYRGRKGEWRGEPTVAGTFEPNEFGLFDMHGNVWEWTQDCFVPSLDGIAVNGAPRTQTQNGTCTARVLKGGAWNTGGWRLRSGHRIGKNAAAREFDNGFRVVREL